jgi:hypothetical protein
MDDTVLKNFTLFLTDGTKVKNEDTAESGASYHNQQLDCLLMM